MIPVIYGTFNFYFIKKRVFAMSLVQILKGIFLMLHPILVGFLLTQYGFRGTVAIVATINANCILAMLAMHPVEWHSKVIKIPVYERIPCRLRFLIFFACIQVPDYSTKSVFDQFFLFLVMISNVDSTAVPNESSEPIRSTVFDQIVYFLDLTLLKDAIYVNIVLGYSFAMFSDSMFNALLPLFLIEKGFSQVW